MPKPRCLSPAANSLYSRIAGRQVPKPRCLSPKTPNFLFSALRAKRCLDLQTKPTQNAFRTLRLAFHSWQTLGRPRSALQKHSVTAVPRGTSVTMNPSQPPLEYAQQCLYSRIAGRQVPKPRCLSLKKHLNLLFSAARGRMPRFANKPNKKCL